MTAIPPNPPPTPDWWSRNWKWFVPVGCLSMILLAVAAVAIVVAIVFASVKSSDVYKQAVRQVESSAEVRAALGEPVKTGWWFSGNMNVNNDEGDADMYFPVYGPRGHAKVHVVAEKDDGRWQFSVLTVNVEGGAPIELVPR